MVVGDPEPQQTIKLTYTSTHQALEYLKEEKEEQ
jgi:hypothetical protein